jgi:hypothetical protein
MTTLPPQAPSEDWELPGFWLWPRAGAEIALSVVCLVLVSLALAVNPALSVLVLYPLAIALLPRHIAPVCSTCRRRAAPSALRCERCGNDDLRGRPSPSALRPWRGTRKTL